VLSDCAISEVQAAFATPSLVPQFDYTVHIVLDDFGKSGRVYREMDEEETQLAATCEEDDLTSLGGNAGAMLFERSRKAPQSRHADAGTSNRRKISLSVGPIRTPVPERVTNLLLAVQERQEVKLDQYEEITGKRPIQLWGPRLTSKRQVLIKLLAAVRVSSIPLACCGSSASAFTQPRNCDWCTPRSCEACANDTPPLFDQPHCLKLEFGVCGTGSRLNINLAC
jgi:hypothetical protein